MSDAVDATLVKGRGVNHVLHLILSLITFGLWVVVWIILALANREKKYMLTVDTYGNVSTQNL